MKLTFYSGFALAVIAADYPGVSASSDVQDSGGADDFKLSQADEIVLDYAPDLKCNQSNC